MILLGAAVLAATAACSSTVDNNASSPTPTVTAVATTPAAPSTTPPVATVTTPPPSAVDISITASSVATDGSVGIRKGTTKLTIHNTGTTAPALTLTFNISVVNVTPDGPFWTHCHPTDDGRTLQEACSISAVPAGGEASYTVGFANIDLSVAHNPFGVVTVGPTDESPSDNTAVLVICTNGCVS
jgi:hypothetical protein